MVMVLGIESTAHTFGIGIVKDGKILANVKKSYTTKHGGIIPIDAAKHHKENKKKIYVEAIKSAKINEDEIDSLAFSQGPGLSPCLLEGMKFVKQLSEKLKKPIVPVNHCVAHLEIGGSLPKKPKDPVMLYTSGANTQIIAYISNKYRIFGETLDIGVGNFIDNFARYLGIGFPGGPEIEKLARKGKKYIELPYKVKGMDIALSGILTNLKQKIEKMNLSSLRLDINKDLIEEKVSKKDNRPTSLQQRKADLPLTTKKKYRASKSERVNYTPENLSYSMQETVFAMLVEISERALAHTGKKELLLGGGVGCNFRLQEMCRIMCRERNAKFFVPENSLLVDNGAMIAFLGEIMFNSGIKFSQNEIDKIDIKPRERTDEVEVSWKSKEINSEN